MLGISLNIDKQNRLFRSLYVDGTVKIVVDNIGDYSFDVYTFQLDNDIFDDFITYAKAEVIKRINADTHLGEDDRCFLDAFCIRYHTAWAGVNYVRYGIDLHDYFFDKHRVMVIQRILEHPMVYRYFTDMEAKKTQEK